MKPGTILPDSDSPLGWASWWRETTDALQCTFAPPPYPDEALPRGNGEIIMLVPGFLVGDWTMARLKQFLTGLNYRVEQADIAINLGPTPGLLAHLESRMVELAQSEKVTLIGQSLGGVMAREIAKRHPDRVMRIITLCTPIHFPVTTPLSPFAEVLAPIHDPAMRENMEAFAEPPPVPVLAIYSEEDGIVDWRQCLVKETDLHRNLHIAGCHTTMGSNPDAQRAIAHALAGAA